MEASRLGIKKSESAKIDKDENSKNKNNNMVNYETFESSSEGEMSQCLFES